MKSLYVCDMPLGEFGIQKELLDEFREIYIEYVERLYSDGGFTTELAAIRFFNSVLEYYGSSKVLIGFTYSEEQTSLVMGIV